MIRIVFATIAIGIGVNIPSIRQVIHVGAARTLESHYQKIGQGGRDEKSTKVSFTTGSPNSLYEPHKVHNMASNYRPFA